MLDSFATSLRSAFLVCLVFATSSIAQDDFDEDVAFLPGLVARYSLDSGSAVQRVDQGVHFSAAKTQRDPTAVAHQPVAVSWTGLLQVQSAGQYSLKAFGNGRVRLWVAGQEILDGHSTRAEWRDARPIELKFGKHEIRVEYELEPDGSRIGLYWSGPDFLLEPIPPRLLWHPVGAHPDDAFAVGERLSRGLRCAACHSFGPEQAPLAAPSLTHLSDNLRPSWLVRQLSAPVDPETTLAARRMPHFNLDSNTAAAISAALFKASQDSTEPASLQAQLIEAAKRRGKKQDAPRTAADIDVGAETFASVGCIACHQVGDLGQASTLDEQLFSGGDLSRISTKRTRQFFQRWLENPAQVNAHHRMPLVQLSRLELLDLIAYLESLGQDDSRNDSRAAGDANLGVGFIARHRCGACHQLPASLAQPIARTPIGSASDWGAGCLTQANTQAAIPGFGLDRQQRVALKTYISRIVGERSASESAANSQPSAGLAIASTAEALLAENNCLACHSRDLAPGISRHLTMVAELHPETAARLAGLSPPALNAIGDKLTDKALGEAILRKTPALRPWLDVRMPKFELTDAEVATLVQYFVEHDRIPQSMQVVPELPTDLETQLAAARLVTADGFGCQSCHQIGDTEPPVVDLKARGTNLAMLGDRLRHSWFHRWVRDPARIVPRMEMPAIKIAAKGLLDDDIATQLEAVWQTLNTPDFRPPRPNPVRVVRSQNLPDVEEPSHVLTDVLETPERVFLRPLIVGLPNRHNVLFDLEEGYLAAWWLGDTARQHTRGKTWYWEAGSEFLNSDAEFLERISIVDAEGASWAPARDGQITVKLDAITRDDAGTHWKGRIHVVHDGQARFVPIEQRIRTSVTRENAMSLQTRVELQPGERVRLDIAGEPQASIAGYVSRIADACNAGYFGGPESHMEPAGERALLITPRAGNGTLSWTSEYDTDLSPGSFPQTDIVWPKIPARPIDVVPGYEAVQLPLRPTEMPVSFAWGNSGEFYAGSLKGHVLQLHDDDADGLHERYATISDGFPTPYGMAAHEQGLDILAKYALIRLTPPDVDEPIWNARVVADGWGYTADYHDWAVGLERDEYGNYYMALPCQQDDRTEAAAYLRGNALMLVASHDPIGRREYRIEPISAGLRFPMGIARSQHGDLFTTDNQGNYNPFNELNHLRAGKRYGFINKLENKDGFSPPFESPAINLPHPWTRSVNGICFLETPKAVLQSRGAPLFGPFEGQLIGCEMNGQALVRMSLQKVGDTYQGAAYMFSRPVREGEHNFEGPIVCEISPDGALYVGNLRDSGWGGGQNTGSIVRLYPDGELPPGIAEVRATPTGFEIDFTQAVDAARANDTSNYSIRSYRRISTPAYGGDDQEERNEPVLSAVASDDRHRVTLRLEPLREGCVYELNLEPLGEPDAFFFPSQAHYSMRAIPE